MTSSAAPITAASTQPPETDPANSLRAFTARRLPGPRGAEPHVSMTAASATPVPASDHAASRPSTPALSPVGGEGGRHPTRSARRAPALDGGDELIVDVPREVDPLLLLE